MTLAEVLRTGRQYDPDGVMVVMSRQACEEAADQLETLAAYKDRARALLESLQNLADEVSIRAAHCSPMAINNPVLIEAVELISECTALSAVESAQP